MTQTIHDDRAKLQHQLDAMQGELETGRAILTSAMNLLDNPRTLYEEAKTPARRVLNKAIFTKLYIDDLGDGPTVTNDELSEPFATVVYARRVEVGLEKGSVRRAALDAVQAVEGPGAGGEASSSDTDTLRWLQAELADGWARGDDSSLDSLIKGVKRHRGDLLAEITPGLTGAVLLCRSLAGACSSRTAMVQHRRGHRERRDPREDPQRAGLLPPA